MKQSIAVLDKEIQIAEQQLNALRQARNILSGDKIIDRVSSPNKRLGLNREILDILNTHPQPLTPDSVRMVAAKNGFRGYARHSFVAALCLLVKQGKAVRVGAGIYQRKEIK